MFNILGGRKFTFVFLGTVLVALNSIFGWGIQEDAIWQIVILIGSVVGAEGVADAVSRFKNKEPIFEDEDEEDEEDEK